MSTALDDRLAAASLVILDGGMGTELEARGHDLTDALWSARLLADAPDEIVTVHRDYLDAGAACIVTASYQATFERFAEAGFERTAARRLLRRSVELALEARGERDALVAASIGPYAGYLADGSEFTGIYDLDEAALLAWHAPRLAELASAGADLLACETIPSRSEARALVRAVRDHDGARAWFSFCCADDATLSDGTPFAACVAEIAAHDCVVAVGLNCTAPQHAAALIRRARNETDKPIVAYPNSGETWDARRRTWIGTRDAADFAERARTWRDAGATWIGGCCRTRPEHIRALREALTR